MAEPVGATLDALIAKAQAALQEVRLIRRDERPTRALIELEGRFNSHRIIISKIHLADGQVRYAYYLLDADNRLVQGFDNSPDIRAIKLRYGKDYRQHLQERVPHQHSADDSLMLTGPMSFDAFVVWLKSKLPDSEHST
jgi:hypothetical protein